MITTVKELSESNGVSYIVAHGFVKFLESRDLAKVVQKKKQSGRGKPTNIYDVSDDIAKIFSLASPTTSMFITDGMSKTNAQLMENE